MPGKVFNLTKGVLSFNGRKGNVIPKDGDYTADQVGAANKGLSNLTNYQRALHNIGGRPNQNLWDNGYFVGGGSQIGYGNLPINQKGKQKYDQANANCIDRHYKSSNTVVELLGDCLKISLYASENLNRFAHKFSSQLIAGKTYTVSALVKNVSVETNIFLQEDGGDYTTPAQGVINSAGIFSITFTCTKSAYYQAIFSNNQEENAELSIVAAKLEEGPFQTLGWEDESGVHLFETPNYGEALSQCQPYILKLSANSAIGYSESNITAFLFVPIPVSMRTTPAWSGTLPRLYPNDGNSVTSVTVISISNNMACLMVNGTGFTAGKIYSANEIDGFLSAEM